MKKYKFLIFDLDDTLFDFQDKERNSLKIICKNNNIPFNKNSLNKYRKINNSLWTQLENGHITKNEVLTKRFEYFFKHYGYSVEGNIIEKEYSTYLNQGHKLLPNAIEILSLLKENGYTIFAGTNSVAITQRIRLKNSKLISLFDDIFISDELGFEKPNVNFYKAIFNKYPEMNRYNSLMIGDSLSSDIQGVKNIGIDSIWFNPTSQKNTGARTTYEIRDLLELMPILTKRGVYDE